jgi:DsbC/DsbD-like thiol-disulfide interchange protein
MTIVLRLMRTAALFAAALLSDAAIAADSSPWAPGFHSRVRLIAGGRKNDRVLAGIEIALDKGFKTYWRTPGESGLPPRFDWSGSTNVADIELRWPVPERADEAGSVAYVYGTSVTLPLLIKPEQASKPVELNLVVDYGVCKDICIPAHAEIRLALPAAGGHGPALDAALARVPRPLPLAAEGALSILSVEPVAADKPAFLVRVRAPAGARPRLFPEGPDDWYLSAQPKAGAPEPTFLVTIEEKPKEVRTPVPLRLTLKTDEDSIETAVGLDADLRPR